MMGSFRFYLQILINNLLRYTINSSVNNGYMEGGTECENTFRILNSKRNNKKVYHSQQFGFKLHILSIFVNTYNKINSQLLFQNQNQNSLLSCFVH